MSVCCAVLPAPALPAGSVLSAGGRHRRAETVATRIGRVVDLVGRLGSAVTLVAVLVVAGAAAGLAGGVSGDGIPTVTVTFDDGGH